MPVASAGHVLPAELVIEDAIGEIYHCHVGGTAVRQLLVISTYKRYVWKISRNKEAKPLCRWLSECGSSERWYLQCTVTRGRHDVVV